MAVWEACDDAQTREDVLTRLSAAFGQPAEAIAGDVDETLGRLVEAGLLTQ